MKKRILSKYDGRKYEWLLQAKEWLFMLLAVFLVFQFVVGAARISGSSMYPALADGDLVLYVRIWSAWDRGDIVYLQMPSGERYVKRIVALEGDVVDIRDGRLYVNGEEDTYAWGVTDRQGTSLSYPYEVEEGRVFVLGDNRETSTDSRTFGSVSVRQIRGRIVWHWKRAAGG